MKVESIVPTTQVVDILCDVCGTSTTKSLGTQEFGTLEACWGYGSQHDGERYQVHQGEIVNILLKIKNSFLPTKQILIGL